MTGKKSELNEIEDKFLNGDCNISELLGETEEHSREKRHGDIQDKEVDADVLDQAADKMEACNGAEKENIQPAKKFNKKRKSTPAKEPKKKKRAIVQSKQLQLFL